MRNLLFLFLFLLTGCLPHQFDDLIHYAAKPLVLNYFCEYLGHKKACSYFFHNNYTDREEFSHCNSKARRNLENKITVKDNMEFNEYLSHFISPSVLKTVSDLEKQHSEGGAKASPKDWDLVVEELSKDFQKCKEVVSTVYERDLS